MHFLSMLLLSLLPGATPLALNRMETLQRKGVFIQLTKLGVTNPDAVDFSSVGDAYKRSLGSPDDVDFDRVGDAYKRSIQSPDEVDFDRVGDAY